MNEDDDVFWAAAAAFEQQASSVAAVPAAPAAPTSGRPQITPRESFFLPRGGQDAKRAREVDVTTAGRQDEEQEKARVVTAHWVWPESLQFPRRDYQYEMVVSSLRANTLVCLPTGLGKTFVAAVVMYNFYAWHPTCKVIFLAPTKPLVAQQVEACYNVMGIPYEDISEMTGATNPSKRNQEWKDKRCFFVTPQVLHNDLNRGAIDPATIRCLVVDEAHRARGSYAYVNVVRSIAARSKQFRVVGLTATPAKTTVEVQDVIDNLLISKLQVRADGDIDVARYVHSKTVEKVVIKLPPEILRIRDAIDNELAKRLQLLCSQKAYFSTDPAKAPEYGLMSAQNAWKAQVNDARGNGQVNQKSIGMVFGAFAHARLLAQGRKILTVHGVVPFLDFCRDKQAEGTKSLKSFLESQQFGQMHGLARKAVEAGFLHPKISELLTMLQAHFGRDADSRVIVFTTLRDSVESIVSAIRNVPHVKVSRFVGQANKGQKQVEQLDVLAKFRVGEFNTLVATCVGEEGLDVGECDLIVLYDSSGSPIRTMQRMGRTGRKRQGRCVSLVTEGTEENVYDRSKSTGNNILRMLQKNKESFRFYAPREEEVVGLVPGRIQKPVLREAKIPDVPMREARRLRKAGTSKPRSAAGKPSKNEAQMAAYLLETYGISSDDLESEWPPEAEMDALLADSVLDFTGLLNRGGGIEPSSRSVLMRELVTFVEEDLPEVEQYTGVGIGDAFGAMASKAKPQKKKPKTMAFAKPIYLDDSDSDSKGKGELGDDDDEAGGGDRWSKWYGEEEKAGKEYRVGEEEEDNALYEPSDVWFAKEPPAAPKKTVVPPTKVAVVLTPACREIDLLEEEEIAAPLAARIPAPILPAAVPREVLAPTPPPPPPPSLPPVAVPKAAAAPTTPRAAVADHTFKTPTSRSATKKRPQSGALDLDVIPKHMRQQLLQMPLNRSKGLFFPPPPVLHQGGYVSSRRIDCAVCSLPFQDNVTLGLHCFEKHWPTDENEQLATNYPRSVVAASMAGVPQSPAPPPTPSLSSKKGQQGESQFEVEAILKKRLRGGRTEYFVRWRGFSTEHCTWEPDENLIACSQILAEFLAKEQKAAAEAAGVVVEVEVEAAEAASAEPAEKRQRQKKKKPKKKKQEKGALAFLDLEANLSGSEGSSDEEDGDSDDDGRGPSWIVEDDEDIVYSGTPPSQPPDLAFYRRANAQESSSLDAIVGTPMQPKRREKTKKKKVVREENAPKQKRLLKRAAVVAEEDEGPLDVVVMSEDTPLKKKPAMRHCSICGQECQSELCGACLEVAAEDSPHAPVGVAGVASAAAVAAAPHPTVAPVVSTESRVVAVALTRATAAAAPASAPPVVAARPRMAVDQKAINGGAIRYLSGVDTVSCPTVAENDGNFILSRSMAALVFTETAFKATGVMVKHILASLERNAQMIVIIECGDPHSSARRGPVFNRIMAQLCALENVSVLMSVSPQETAAILARLLSHVVEAERLTVTHDWMSTRREELAFLTRCPCIGVGRGISLLSSFSSMGQIVAASAQQLGNAIGSVELLQCQQLVNWLASNKK